MKYTLVFPPKSPGIYALKNTKTGHVYIGQSTNLARRLAEWRMLITNKVGRTSKDLMAMAGSPEDWEFQVLAIVGRDQLNDLEIKAIERVWVKSPDLCLNRSALPRGEVKEEPEALGPSGAKSTVLSPTGMPMTHGEVARACRVTKDHVKQKLARLRDRGVFSIKVDELFKNYWTLQEQC